MGNLVFPLLTIKELLENVLQSHKHLLGRASQRSSLGRLIALWPHPFSGIHLAGDGRLATASCHPLDARVFLIQNDWTVK
jgi:hypothetical protein